MSADDDTLRDMATKASRRPKLKLGRRAAAEVAADGESPRPYADSRLEDLVVITGYSGAGKSTAMAVFEDAGYFCVDNLPPEMIRQLVELFMHEGSKVERAAVVSDVRGGDLLRGAAARCSTTSRRSALRHRVLFLDADEQTLLTRYKETRRRHPLAPRGERRAGHRRRARAARAAARARRRRHRHDGPEGAACCAAGSPRSSCRARRPRGWR